MSWGYKIIIIFSCFVILIGSLVYNAMNTKFELVSKDYYKDELKDQDKIEGAENTVMAGVVTLTQDAENVSIHFPAALNDQLKKGEAWFYCKTNEADDKKISFQTIDSTILIPKRQLHKASYELKLQWTISGKPFYHTGNIIIQ